MTDDEVVQRVQALVAAGEYRDEILGVPGARLSGFGAFRGDQRMYVRGSPEHLEARAAGLVEKLPPLTPASPDAVKEAELLLGHPLPLLLRRLYLEVGNGGFGPGYGILGLRGGHGDEYGNTALDLYPKAWSGPSVPGADGRPPVLLPLCHWGCAIHSLVDCADPHGRMWGCDPNPVPENELDKALFRESMTIREWLARWLDGRLYQPTLVRDPDTDEWRGATDEEHEAWMAEF